MFYYVDESGNTGLKLFDPNQPILYYGMIGCTIDIDIFGEPLLLELRKALGVKRIHASELGVGRLTPIASRISQFCKKNDVRFSLMKVVKADHAIMSFFDQVFDSGVNKAVRWDHYFTPLRYVLLFKVAHLFDEHISKKAWEARKEVNPARSAQMLVEICGELLGRVPLLVDARSREIVSDALKWAAANPTEISYGVGNLDSALQISPNLVGFQNVLMLIAQQSSYRKKKVLKIIVDRQSEFNKAQGVLSDMYRRIIGHKWEMGPGMPAFDFSTMPDVPPTFTPGDASAGLELVDVALWVAKRRSENKPLSPELEDLFWALAKRGHVDEVSFAGLDKRWRHLLHLPTPDGPLSDELQQVISRMELERRRQVEGL